MSIQEGRKARDAGIDEATAAADAHWRAVAHGAVADLINEGESFTADDVWQRIHQLDPAAETHNNSALGGIILANVRNGRIQRIGYEQSTRKSRHVGTVARYVPAQR